MTGAEDTVGTEKIELESGLAKMRERDKRRS